MQKPSLNLISAINLSLLLLITGCESEIKVKGRNVAAANTTGVTDRGQLDVTTAWLGDGNYVGYNAAALPVTEVCSTSTIFGVQGTAACGGSINTFADLMASMAYKSDNDTINLSSQAAVDARLRATLTQEGAAHATFTTHHSLVPNPATDHDGRYDPQGGVNEKKHHLVTVKGGRPNKLCGLAGASIQDRVDDCAIENTTKAIYEGQKYGQGGEGDWQLVTVVSTNFCRDQNFDGDQAGCVGNYGNAAAWTGSQCVPYGSLIRSAAGCAGSGFTWTAPQGVATGDTCSSGFYGGCFEVWRDERTKLIWSDLHVNDNYNFGGYNWFQAAGYSKNASTQTDTYYEGAGPTVSSLTYDPNNGCSDPTQYTCQPDIAISVCVHPSLITGPNVAAAYQNPDGTNGTIDETHAKGNLTAATYQWRLPTKEDFQLADVNGIRKVLQSMDDYAFWSASSISNNASNAWAFYGSRGGYIVSDDRFNVNGVVCVGR